MEKIKLKKQKKRLQRMALPFSEGIAENATSTTELPGNESEGYYAHKPAKGIELLFRISAANNIRISVMADNKSHIMISVNSIIISVILALVIRKIDDNRAMLIPAAIMLSVNVVTIIYAILATRPKIPNGVFTQEEVGNKSVNLLYFGNYYNMNFPEYEKAVKTMMQDSEFIYNCLIQDLFGQGKVLGRKYRLLRIAYTVFLYGITISVAAFLIAGFTQRP